VVTNSHACQRWLSAQHSNIEEAQAAADRIIRAANSAAVVVNRIRALFKHSALSKSSVDINEVIAEVCQLMSKDIMRKDTRIETDLERELPSTLVDRVQMQQVLVNLIRNGIDAMESTFDGARLLVVRSRRDERDTIVVEVRDHGTGIADPARIFEPFFTTKEKGMGLAICRSIVEAHDGRLWAQQNEPRGALFTLALPMRASHS
jgi:signal transduction histidine kinase